MIAYKKEWLDNLRIHKAAYRWLRIGIIDQSQVNNIKNEFVSGYKKTNLFLRIGLAVFTLIATLAAIGLTFLASGYKDSSIMVVFFLVAAMCWVALEICVREKNYFRHGIDDMLLYCSLTYFIIGLLFLSSNFERDLTENDTLMIAVLTLPVLFIAAIRFADAVASLSAYICFLLIIFILVDKIGTTGKTIMPFVILSVSFFAYRFFTAIKKKQKTYYYNHCLIALQAASLITLYAAGNYFVVREASAALFGLSLKPGEDIPLAVIFYALTFAIPVVYITLGVKNKDRIFLRTGIVLTALAVLTYRYYYHIISTEVALTASGILLITLSWLVIRKLKTPWRGITFKGIEDEIPLSEAEGLLIAQTFGQQAAVKPIEGGGQFGGGGASGNF